MRIFVNAKARSGKEYIKKIDETHFVVAIKEAPEKGKANEAIVKAVAGYFKGARSGVRIVSGHTSQRKILEII